MIDPEHSLPRRRRARAVVIIAWLAPAVVLSSCSSRCGKKQVAVELSDAQVASVELLDPGRPPLVTISVGRWAGLVYTSELTNRTSVSAAGAPAPNPPAAVMKVRFEVLHGTADPVVRPGPDGGARLVEERAVVESLEVRNPSAPPELLQKTNDALSSLVGTSMRQLVGEDGAIVEVDTETVGGVVPPARIKQMIDNLWATQRHFPFRLPPGPVGVGAHWRFSDPTERQGVRTIQVSDMTLVSMDDRTVTIRIRVQLAAPRQEVKNPMDPDAVAMLEQFRGEGEGELTLDRLTAVILSARLGEAATLKLSAYDTKGKQQFLTVVSAVRAELRSVIGAPEAGAPEPPSPAGPDAASPSVPGQ